jgi:hypothetical protein
MFDMTKCKVGDKLISRQGGIYTFLGTDDSAYYPYVLTNQNGGQTTRTVEGYYWANSEGVEWDIVGFATDKAAKPKSKPVRKVKRVNDTSAFAMALDRAMMIYIRDTSSNTTPAYVWVAYIKECMQTFNKMMKSRDVYKGLDPKKLVTARRK